MLWLNRLATFVKRSHDSTFRAAHDETPDDDDDDDDDEGEDGT